MRISRVLGLATVASLAIFSMTTAVQAQIDYDVSANWLTTYPTTTSALAATSATWGTGNIWSAGLMSSNFVNTQTTPAYQGTGYEDLTTYYNANSVGYENSGATVVASFTYTVPFQTYQLNPGSTINLAVGQAMTEQVASGFKAWSGAANALSLPTGMTSQGATSGIIREVAAVKEGAKQEGSVAGVYGFDTTAYSGTSSFKDGSTSILSTPGGVFYNYNTTNATSSSEADANFPRGTGDTLATGGTSYDTVQLTPTFGPTYVAWTAPVTENITIKLNAWDVGNASGDGIPSFFVMNSTAGPTAPMLKALSLVSNGSLNGNVNAFTAANNNVSATQGTIGYLGALSGYTAEGSGYPGSGFNWQSGTISVTQGEVLYFVADPTHTVTGSAGAGWWGEHAYEGYQDPIALNLNILTPEPSGFALLGMAGVGLALAAWRRRRAAELTIG